jgi:hypothetical protein
MTATEQSETPTELAEFTDWFVKNYPGRTTIISDPKWHAPKIFRAATHRLERTAAKLQAENAELRKLRDGWCDEYTKARNCLREVMELLDSWDITHIGPEPLHEAETIWADTIRRAQEYCK